MQADKCEVTLEGYRRLVQTHGPQETLYRLGYEAAVEKQVPLVQRAGESVYVGMGARVFVLYSVTLTTLFVAWKGAD